MRDNIELNKKLVAEMPYLAPHNAWTGEVAEDYDYSYIEGDYDLPAGWNKLFLQMCRDIKEPLGRAGIKDKFYFMQLKEKWNSLRAYHNGATEEVERIIQKYSHLSQFVCSKCGKPATYETSGYILSYCTDCWSDMGRHKPGELITYDPILTITRYTKEGKTTEMIDCGEEWRRLYDDVR